MSEKTIEQAISENIGTEKRYTDDKGRAVVGLVKGVFETGTQIYDKSTGKTSTGIVFELMLNDGQVVTTNTLPLGDWK